METCKNTKSFSEASRGKFARTFDDFFEVSKSTPPVRFFEKILVKPCKMSPNVIFHEGVYPTRFPSFAQFTATDFDLLHTVRYFFTNLFSLHKEGIVGRIFWSEFQK